MIRDVNDRYPDVLFLAEAFTGPDDEEDSPRRLPAELHLLPWRNTKDELATYATELAGEMGEYYRPNFFANTPDINPVFLQTSGRRDSSSAARSPRRCRASTASITASSSANRAGPGKEDYLDSEKYELKAWDYYRPGNIRDHIIALNRIRRENPALWDFRNVVFTRPGTTRSWPTCG